MLAPMIFFLKDTSCFLIRIDICFRNSSANFVNQTLDVCKVYEIVAFCSPEEHA